MTKAVHRPALQIIQIAFAVMVGQPHPITRSKDQRRALGNMQERIRVVVLEGHIDGFGLVHGD